MRLRYTEGNRTIFWFYPLKEFSLLAIYPVGAITLNQAASIV